ncbi:uncharacterized protein LOC111348226 [Spodoptera litura]|uniref:Uncharacterized protein LOC111348226 n=2 Tax=Spodoptera litura TaxID=69820 RepID=A0A9J7DQI8_SPOLT|nr:uncharacterized protein LOC111348226 [Spodoptera litura]
MTYNRTENIGKSTSQGQHDKLTHLIQSCKYPQFKHKLPNNGNGSNTVVNLSSKQLSADAVNVLTRGLNYAPAPRKLPVEDIITNVENTIFRNRIPRSDAECLRQDVSSLLRKSSPPKSNIPVKEMSALRDLRNDSDILVLPADKGNATVVVDTEAYEQKITHMLSDTTVYKQVSYDPTARVTTKTIKLLQSLSDKELVARLRPQNPTPPKIYGLPKIHKPNWPLRPIVSQIDAPTYNLSRHLATILQPFTGKTNTFVKDSRHFVALLEDVRLQDTDIMISFDITSLFTNVPVDETISIITNILKDTDLPTGYIACVNHCLTTGYFLWRGEYYLQVNGVAMGSPLAPVVANIYMEWFEGQALASAPVRPRHWWRYVDDVFAIVNREHVAEFVGHLNSVHGSIQFTTEEEREGMLPFLDVLPLFPGP